MTMGHVSRMTSLFFLSLTMAALPVGGQEAPIDGPVVLVTGSNRGIGFEFARQYAEAGWNVIATARDPDRAADLHRLAEQHPKLRIERLDVTDVGQIEALARKYDGWPIDVLLNNAGVLGSASGQSMGELDGDEFQRVMAVNAFGPLKVAQAFLDHVARSDQKKVVTITSGSGSLGLAAPGGGAYQPGFVYYRASKAAVNMAMLALHAYASEQGILIGLYTPPFTESDMAQEVRDALGRDLAAQPVDEVVMALIARIEELDTSTSGVFMTHEGSPVPW